MKPSGRPRRWLVLGVFVLSTAINYLDRQTLATLAPLLRAEFHLSNTDYGFLLTAFSITYAISAPFAGLLIDSIGLNRAISLAVTVWSCSGIWTGFTSGMAGLTGCRAVLGLSEAAGIPAAGKAIHQYLLPSERALGNALNQAGVSLGLVLAPPIATWIAVAYGWRNAFVVTGLLGLLWIPVWNVVAARFGGIHQPARQPIFSGTELLRHSRLWAFVAANALSMTGYSLWTNWTTTYLVDVHHLTLVQAAWFAWIPPLFATAGGVAGGWYSQYLMRRGVEAVTARTRACATSSVLALASALVPVLPGPAWASAGISLSIFAVAAFSVNMYTMPLDTFGGARAAFATSILVASYGGVQALASPAFGAIIDARGYTPVCLLVSFLPLAAYGILKGTEAPA
ncbi:MAG TPA: MFS transporter [Bryobacteraceae bacterium]|nr:MFS transporter [Bryobacteraceae bacterium]